MGDAGSMLIGFIVAWLLLRISQDASSGIEPVTVLFVVAVPISDLLWVFSIRMIRGQSPFRADNSHLHHYLLKAGLSHSGALSILSLVAILISIFGLSVSLLSLTGLQLIGIFLLCCGSLVFCVSNADRWVSVLPRAFKPLARGA
jgi:UDP-GlcNAc:undecaprenyl-phosphate GlcNAc-1-phosphate transferase